MKSYKGSFSVEAAFIMPLVLLCFCIAINVGISMQAEIKQQVSMQMEERTVEAIACMYRAEYIKELVGDFYEN